MTLKKISNNINNNYITNIIILIISILMSLIVIVLIFLSNKRETFMTELDLKFKKYIEYNPEYVISNMTNPENKYYEIRKLDFRDYYDMVE